MKLPCRPHCITLLGIVRRPRTAASQHPTAVAPTSRHFPPPTTKTLAVCAAFAAAAVLYAFPLAPVASAAKSGNGNNVKQTATAPLSLTSESVQYSTDPLLPTSCLTEDDFDTRIFFGYLAGSYSTSYQLCGLDLNGWTAGGIGLETDVYVVGTLTDLTITAPDGTADHAVLMGTSTSKGVTTSHYATCYVPPYYLSTDTGTDPLAGGSWQITLSGQISNASWITSAQMTDVVFQHNYCPLSEQNLLS